MAGQLGKAALHSFNSLMGEKPHSSITDWIEILSSSKYSEDEYEGIPELVDSINLQAGGPTEASRAIRKKLKYGDVHRQLRALTILKALVENCGPKFQSSFANDPLTERIKTMSHDSMTDERVKKKLMSVLASWNRQFKDDPKMALVAGLYAACGGGGKKVVPRPVVNNPEYEEQRRKAEDEARERISRKEALRKQQEEAKRKAKADKEEARKPKPTRKPFSFAEEKPKVLVSISIASQTSNNLINALKLVNREQESIASNARVQECLAEAKAARKAVVRYIQLVEDENFIGTLIDSNERVIAALQLYDYMLKPADQDSDEEHEAEHGDLTGKMQSMQMTGGSTHSEPELLKLQERQRVAIEHAKAQQRLGQFDSPGAGDRLGVHPDLQDLTFGELGASGQSGLPPPIQPDADLESEHLGTLSDFSDYESSDEEAHARGVASTYSDGLHGNRAYTAVVPVHDNGNHALLDLEDDPFADPGTESEVGTPGIVQKKMYVF